MGFGDFLSTKWDELTGKNQKVTEDLIGSEYDTAQGTWDADTGTGTGAMGTYGQLQQTGFDMMDPNSARNRAEKARMDSTGADAAAEASRLAGRNASMVGGAPAGALAAQTQAGANTAQAGSNQAYNQYLTGQFGQGMGMVSGAANNMASMGMNRMNAVSNQRQANAMIDSQATGFGANMLGKGLGMFNPGGMGVTLAGKLASYGGQEGGYMGFQEGGYTRNTGGMLSQIMGPDGIPMHIRTRIGGQTVG